MGRCATTTTTTTTTQNQENVSYYEYHRPSCEGRPRVVTSLTLSTTMIRFCSLALVAISTKAAVVPAAMHKTTFLNTVSLTIPDAVLALQSGSHEIHFGKFQCHLDISSTESTVTLRLPPLLPDQPISSLLHAIVSSSSHRLQRPYKFSPAAGEQLVTSSTKEVEMVDWMSIDGLTSLAELPRTVVHQHNLLHRGIGVLILDNQGRIFVHQRSNTKRLFPAMYDMFVGK